MHLCIENRYGYPKGNESCFMFKMFSFIQELFELLKFHIDINNSLLILFANPYSNIMNIQRHFIIICIGIIGMKLLESVYKVIIPRKRSFFLF